MTKKKISNQFQVIQNGIVLNFVEEPEGGYTVSVPQLPGCISYGKNFEEALAMIFDAMNGWLEVAKEEGLLIPEYLQSKQNNPLQFQFSI
jgi:predicted RNase H-like HicB family nuclease